MTTYRLDLSWDGTAYCGWQRQPSHLSIQECVERALRCIFPTESIVVHAAGRTDAGVHALQQIAGFSIIGERDPWIIQKGLNSKLPVDIVCLSVERMEDGFHPRYASKEKLYRYRILNRSRRCPFRNLHTWHIPQSLDVHQMHVAAKYFEGTHDFQAFRAQKCSANSTVRTITRSELLIQGDELHFEVQGKGFLRHMVRIMTGTLISIGRQRKPATFIEEALHCTKRTGLGETAPSHGLWLVWTSLLDKECEIE